MMSSPLSVTGRALQAAIPSKLPMEEHSNDRAVAPLTQGVGTVSLFMDSLPASGRVHVAPSDACLGQSMVQAALDLDRGGRFWPRVVRARAPDGVRSGCVGATCLRPLRLVVIPQAIRCFASV